MDNAPPSFVSPNRNWWQRNWKWLIPTGCVSLLGVLALLVVILIALGKFVLSLHLEQWL